ncbi:LOW QUALITY PROTEIN: calpain-12 [Spinachia spinachia]
MSQVWKVFAVRCFPPLQTSIGMPKDPDPIKAIKWRRPKEIGVDDVFVEDTIGTTDICQGQLGNCWLLAGLSCLTMHPTLFEKVVPPNQSLSESYAGIFHFRFWQYGEWVEVVVDDRLPVRKGRLLFSYSDTRNEYWSALVEKAYARQKHSFSPHLRCYGSLKGGHISEGLEDFTGGIASLQVSSRSPQVLWRSLTAALSRGSLLSCFIQARSNTEIGKVSGDGLVRGHAYAITDSDKVRKASDETLLLRLRNLWGFVEYRGPWGDASKEWHDGLKAEKERIHLKHKEDGEFWFVFKKKKKQNSDGARTPEEQKRAEKQKDKAKQRTVFVELLQRNRRKKTQVDFINIAFHIYKVPSELKGVCLSRKFFTTNSPVCSSGKYEARRTQDLTCSSSFLQVMAPPLSLEDQERVKKTFDEETGAVRNPHCCYTCNYFFKVYIWCNWFLSHRMTVQSHRGTNRNPAVQSAPSAGVCVSLCACMSLCVNLLKTRRAGDWGSFLNLMLLSFQSIFFQFDEDSSGTKPFELSAALQAVGMQCEGKVLELLSESFASGEAHMPFHGFVSCVTRIQKLFETSPQVKDRGINSVSISPNMPPGKLICFALFTCSPHSGLFTSWWCEDAS